MNWLEATLARMDDWDKLGLAFCLILLALGFAVWVTNWVRRQLRAFDRAWLQSMKETPPRGPTIRLAPDIPIGELLHKLRSSELVLSNDPSTGQLVLHRRKQ